MSDDEKKKDDIQEPSSTPEKEPELKETEQKKENMYDKFQYWGQNTNNNSSNNNKESNNKPNNNGGKNNMGSFFSGGKNRLTLIIFIVLLLSFVFMFFNDSSSKAMEVTYSEFVSQVNAGRVANVQIVDETIVNFMTTSGEERTARIPYYDSSLLTLLKDNNVVIRGTVQGTSIWVILLQLLPWIIFIVFMVMIFRQSGAAGGTKQMSAFGKSHAQQYKEGEVKTTFQDVAGQKEAKFELQEVVDFLKHPARFKEIGAKIPKGMLLVGPPGTGKTLLARAVAGEAGVSFLHTSGSDFVEMFVGMGAARVRDLFKEARTSAPCILFVDELDAVGRSRGSGLGGGHDEREQTLNQLLVEMDGFSSDPGVIVIAATNRPDVLDPALLRPGRFDRQVVVDLPDVQERLDILKIHAKKVKLSDNVDLSRIARATPGNSGADLANLVNEAALFAARRNQKVVSMVDFENARDKTLLGVARESKFMTPDEKKATAYHEAGHTLLHYYLKNTDPLHKVTIIPHGRALGVTISLPEKDSYTWTKSRLMDRICICMGGYVAEDIVYGETTTGTSNDIKQATDMARRMVTEWGMSDLGFINLGSDDEPLFLGREIAQHKDYSDATARRIDDEMEKILNEGLATTRKILTEHRDQLDELTNVLFEKETLDDSEIREMFGFPPIVHEFDLA